MNTDNKKHIMFEKHDDSNSTTSTIIKTDVDAKDGQTKCPKCGSTDISVNENKGMLRCNFCRHEFEPEQAIGLNDDIRELKGEVRGSGAKDIIAGGDILTFKCSSCGAEVVIDTRESSQARCHWCRNTLSVNQQIPNGSIPDMVLPFNVTKETAKAAIEKFVGSRKFFAHPKFSKEFTTQNVMGVYFPYMVLDINAHANLQGQGEHQINVYSEGEGKDRKTFYDVELYDVGREFDIVIDDLTIESSLDKLQRYKSDRTNNVINAIMPFDTENCVKWDANYLKGYNSEKRDTNVGELHDVVKDQASDIVRLKANTLLKNYDRGVKWSSEKLDIKGQKWNATYLPVWLYSYQQEKGSKEITHYVAVNGRTREVMGSVPLDRTKLLLVSLFIEALGVLGMVFIDYGLDFLLLLPGVIFYFVNSSKYRNAGARHQYERETKAEMQNIKNYDNFVTKKMRLTNSSMEGANNTRISGGTFKMKKETTVGKADINQNK